MKRGVCPFLYLFPQFFFFFFEKRKKSLEFRVWAWIGQGTLNRHFFWPYQTQENARDVFDQRSLPNTFILLLKFLWIINRTQNLSPLCTSINIYKVHIFLCLFVCFVFLRVRVETPFRRWHNEIICVLGRVSIISFCNGSCWYGNTFLLLPAIEWYSVVSSQEENEKLESNPPDKDERSPKSIMKMTRLCTVSTW